MSDRNILATVIIPTYNRAEILEKCLDALSKQTLPLADFQVIVADDGSGDDTGQRARRFQEEVFPNLLYLRQPNSGQNAARNNAIRHAAGPILFFFNDDTVATPGVLETHLACHREYPAENVAVLGRITMSPDMPPSLFAKLHLDTAFDLWKGRTELDWHAFFTCNISVKKTFLEKYGLFDESLRYNDDVELAERLSHHGLRIMYKPEALGYHYHHLTETSYLELGKLSGKTLALWYKKSPHLKDELASVGFYLGLPAKKRLKYLAAGILVNRRTIPLMLFLARRLSKSDENLSLMFYRKIYKALERENIRHEMRRK
ncbi:MAG TPA: glycosyltransferase family A protein [Syntrophorhabdaceae bacterium]|jgi:glycosyltransferase involved in cell wall biosynthesis